MTGLFAWISLTACLGLILLRLWLDTEIPFLEFVQFSTYLWSITHTFSYREWHIELFSSHNGRRCDMLPCVCRLPLITDPRVKALRCLYHKDQCSCPVTLCISLICEDFIPLVCQFYQAQLVDQEVPLMFYPHFAMSS